MVENWLNENDSFRPCGRSTTSVITCIPNTIGSTHVIIMEPPVDGIWIGKIHFKYKDTNGNEKAHSPNIILKLTFFRQDNTLIPVVEFNKTWYSMQSLESFEKIVVMPNTATLESKYYDNNNHSPYIMLLKNQITSNNPYAELSRYFGTWSNDSFTPNPLLQKAGSPPKWRSTGRKIKIDGKTRTLFSHPSHPEPRLRKMVQRGTKTVAIYVKVKK